MALNELAKVLSTGTGRLNPGPGVSEPG